jgi:hypothetical protein
LSVAMVSVPAVCVLSESGLHPARPAPELDGAAAEEAGAGLDVDAAGAAELVAAAELAVAAVPTGGADPAGAALDAAGAAAGVEEAPHADSVSAGTAPSATRKTRG